jgi:hypothetical protein
MINWQQKREGLNMQTRLSWLQNMIHSLVLIVLIFSNILPGSKGSLAQGSNNPPVPLPGQPFPLPGQLDPHPEYRPYPGMNDPLLDKPGMPFDRPEQQPFAQALDLGGYPDSNPGIIQQDLFQSDRLRSEMNTQDLYLQEMLRLEMQSQILLQADPPQKTIDFSVLDISPYIFVDEASDYIYSYNWPIGSELTIEVNDPGTVSNPDVSRIVTLDPSSDSTGQYFGNDIDIQPGFIISVSDGITTKTHTVALLQITETNPVTDIVSGQAEPGSLVTIYGCYSSCVWRDKIVDPGGLWQVNYSIPGDNPGETETLDLVGGTNGWAYQYDGEGNATILYWRVPNPRFTVYPTNGTVVGIDWPVGAELTIEVDDPGTIASPDYTTTTLVDAGGEGSFDLNSHIDLQLGFLVTITDGNILKSHTVAVEITGVSPIEDTVSGLATPGIVVGTYACSNAVCASRNETADPVGLWQADFSVPGDESGEAATLDLVEGADGQTSFSDEDGDTTHLFWRVPNPVFSVYPEFDQVSASDWPVGAELTVDVDDPATVLNPDASQTATVLSRYWDPTFGYANIYFGDMIDIQAGFVVTVTDGVTTKTHTVTALVLTTMDPLTDIVSGTAAPGSLVEVQVCASNCAYRSETADSGGLWQEDFSVPGAEPGETATLDIGPGTWVSAYQYDEDSDSTQFSRNVPNPVFTVFPEFDQVSASDWPAGAELTVNVDDPATGLNPDASRTVMVSPYSNNPSVGYANLDFSDVIDIQAGFVVTVTDGVTTKTHTVTALVLTTMDPLTDIVSGTAAPGSLVEVQVCASNCAYRTETADSGGLWQEDFSVPGADPGETATLDIGPGTWVYAFQYDEDGDQTVIESHIPNPYILVYPNNDTIRASDWYIGTNITIEVDDPGTGLNPDFSQTVTVEPAPGNPGWGSVELKLADEFDVQAGFIVTITDGLNTKTHIVTALQVTAVNVDTDTISGIAEPGSLVYSAACGSTCASHTETAAIDGAWQADYSVPGDGPGIVDIVPGSFFQAYQFDEDGDYTIITAPTISGNAGVAGANLEYMDGTLKSVIANDSGDYAFTVSYNWSGTVTPSLPSYIFSPVSRDYVTIKSDQPNQDYIATTYQVFLPLVIKN